MSNEGSGSDDAAVVTVFRSTLRPEAVEEYERTAERMDGLVRAMPGFVDYKTFTSVDGERVSVVTFASMEDHQAWRNHPEHREAPRRGRERLYATFSIQVCTCIAQWHFAP
jgi:heme-degrading monooxygenase HmoA